jgi:uncharacterized membrane protein
MDEESQKTVKRGAGTTNRAEAFSDGVFAVAITLLILEIHVPQPQSLTAPGELVGALLKQWPSLVAFLLSFVLVLIAWINHYQLYTHIRRTDGPFLFLNGFLLLMITLLPFTTSLLATYMQHPQAKVAGIIYAGSNLLTAISFQLLWRYASYEGRLLKQNVNHAMVARISHHYNKSFPFCVVAVLFSFINLPITLVIIALMFTFYAVTGFMGADGD